MHKTGKGNRAFTLAELTVILGIIVLLGATLLPTLARVRGGSQRVVCADNLKQIGQAFQGYAPNHGSRWPMMVASTQGGPPNQTAFFLSSTYGAPYLCQVFGVMSNMLGTPKILVCPSDERRPQTNFYTVVNNSFNPPGSGLDNSKISYFLGKDAAAVPHKMILAGDRNIYGNAPGLGSLPSPIPNGGYGNGPSTPIAMGTNFTGSATPCWTPMKMHQSQGNVLFTDGSVQGLTSAGLRQQLSSTGDISGGGSSPGPNTLLFP
jgi:prepilin-type processing-associated H-X9-DG protein